MTHMTPNAVNMIARRFVNSQGLGNVWFTKDRPEDRYYNPEAIPSDISKAVPFTLGQASLISNHWMLWGLVLVVILGVGAYYVHKKKSR